ncbi:MAG: hypothetical protein WA951_13940 [Leeuwenhoekiella sp.]
MIDKFIKVFWSLIVTVLLGNVESAFSQNDYHLQNRENSSSENQLLSYDQNHSQALEVNILMVSIEESTFTPLPLLSKFRCHGVNSQRHVANYLSNAILPYFLHSQTIIPGLSHYKLLYPFHSFS